MAHLVDVRNISNAAGRQPARCLTATVSVCVVNWNCRELLRACLASLVDADHGVELEVIVVDNGSIDGAAAMAAWEFPQVRLIRNDDNRGFARANNQAARAASGDYLFFLNNDTQVAPGAIRTLVEYLAARPEAILVGPRLRAPDGRVQVSYRQRPTPATFLHRTWLFRVAGAWRGAYRAYRRMQCETNEPCDVDVLMGTAVLVRRGEFWDLGGWDEDFAFGGEDLELCHRAGLKGQIAYCPQAEITHVGSVSTRANVAFATPRIAAGFVQYFRKAGASPAELLLYKLVLTLDAPLQIVAKTVQFGLRWLTGRPREAKKSWDAVKGTAAFLFRGLGAFWRA
jgi:GT2 family glycosyltransferase